MYSCIRNAIYLLFFVIRSENQDKWKNMTCYPIATLHPVSSYRDGLDRFN
jgi:hypothetical protein